MVKRYLNKISLTEALNRLKTRFKDFSLESEIIKTTDAEGRVTAAGVKAKRSAPDFYAAAMDGIAVKAEKTDGAGERTPCYLKIGQDAVPVDTGDPIPVEFNAVIKIEEVNQLDENTYLIEKPAAVWNHIRSIGESVVKNNLLVTANHKIRDYDIGALIEAGVNELDVYKKVKVTIIPTGNELIPAEKDPKVGELVEFNSLMIRAALKKWGAEVKITEITADQKDLIENKIDQEKDFCDILIILSGSSAGRKDYTIDILQNKGEILFHGVNIMPGKPIILADLEGKAVFGLPGYPLSAWLDTHLFIKELLFIIQKIKAAPFTEIEAEVRRKIPSEVGLEEFLRVNLSCDSEDVFSAVPLKRGSSAMESIVKADGIMRISENKEGVHSGDKVPVILLKEKNEIKENLLLIGSHDLSLDLIKNEIAKRNYGFNLKTQTVGSMAGLTALRRKESHLAGAHLLDPKTGQYNISYLKKFFKGERLALINLVYREQGFYIKKRNPKKIENIADLTKANIKYVNRQRGAGTRVLFDYLLAKNGIAQDKIAGYEKEEYTHLAAAAAVGRGEADAALGIRAAAQVMEVDFIPVAEEKYDLIIKAELLDDPRVEKLIKLIREEEIKNKIEKMGGYRCTDTGKIKILQL